MHAEAGVISNVQPDTAPVVLNSAVGLSTATLVATSSNLCGCIC